MERTDSEAPRVVIATGAGRYADPWHPFSATSHRIAEILRADGWDAVVDEDVDHALAHLDGVDLLVVNAGDPWRDGGAPHADPAAAAGLAAAIDRGIGLIGVHAALSSLRDHPAWRAAIGGEWVPGTSWHPPIGDARVRVVDAVHPVTDGLLRLVPGSAEVPHFDVFDERYSDLVVDDGARVLAVHDVDGTQHPAVWVREQPTRAVVSSLGHDERAYDSPDLGVLLQRAARWAARI
ncbi:ThuA domain-containing protein [Microbacterium jejuense]|uniref:ThuA domain-containing protein n=1 Tax=Microbacterium jejuense TaxID=1263637 RepID=A0ABS7HUR9_9MICO|nr:ThuA domain-containing protein [Microbacterium jejuense]MBW9095754.1 ThuA domain-containing protein [Microbacterium jejuense]